MWREAPKFFSHFLPKNSKNMDKMSNDFEVNHEKNENDHKYQGSRYTSHSLSRLHFLLISSLKVAVYTPKLKVQGTVHPPPFVKFRIGSK